MKFFFGELINVVKDDAWQEKHKEVKEFIGGEQYEYGSAVFCRVVSINNNFQVFVKCGNEYFVRVFDQNWQFTGLEKKLTPEGVRETDEDVASDGEYIYHFAMIGSGAGQIRKFDKDFNMIAKTPIFEPGLEDIVGDQNIAVIKGKIYAGSIYREKRMLWREGRQQGMHNIPPNNEIKTGAHLRVFNTNLKFIEERNIMAKIDKAKSPNQYWGMGASQLYADGYYCVVAASPIGNMNYFNKGESIGARQIFILRFDDNFNFIDSKGPLTDTDNDNYWCTGSWYEDGKYYISYTSREEGEGRVLGPKEPDELGTFSLDLGNINLGIYDKNFNELETIKVTNFKAKPGVISIAAHRSKILKIGNKIYVSYDTGKESFIQEVLLNGA